MRNSRKGSHEINSASQIIVEEKVVKFNGEINVKKYSKGKFLGKGGFAKCYEFTNLETKKVIAAKIVAKSSLTKHRAKQKLMSEIKIHRSLRHCGIVGFEHFFEDQENVYILLEMCGNQTMNELIKRRRKITELEVQCYLMQIVNSLNYLHSHRVIHRDLKLGNLFLTDKMEVKIGDFGLATKLEYEGERKRTICGTPNYIAPEILEGKHGHSYEVDVWSLGVIIYTLLIGKPPFETSDVKTTYRRIRMNCYSFPDHVVISDSAKDLIKRILHSDPSKRLKIRDIMEHSFLTSNTIPKLLPASTLACPPSSTYLKQFIESTGTAAVNNQPAARLESTAPINSAVRGALKERNNLLNTDRITGRISGNVGGVVRQQTAQGSKRPCPSEPKPQEKMDKYKIQQKGKAGHPGHPHLRGGEGSGGTGSAPKGPEVWVKKWVDYSSKYGLGYLLSNGATGVFFNDSSKIILDQDGRKFQYIERRQTDRQDISSGHTLDNYPKEIHKKVTLLQHFRSYLEGDATKGAEGHQSPQNPGSTGKDGDSPIYVKKWLRTKHAIMFRLSTKIVQVSFQDQTEIILSSESRVVTYVNKTKERLTYPLNTALESSNLEMTKRLKYTKDILTHMINNNGQKGQGTGGSSSAGSVKFGSRQGSTERIGGHTSRGHKRVSLGTTPHS